MNPIRKYGRVCSKHPHLGGLRTADNHCIECERERKRTPEYRAKEKARWQTPKYRAKENARRQKPEYRAKKNACRRAKRTTLKANGISYYAQQSANNLNYKFTKIFRIRIRNEIKSALGTKTEKSSDLLGCTFTEAIAHIETQFQPGMNWDNWSRDGWHIDHIIPCAAFDLSDPAQRRQCFHYTNLRPLWATENLSKNSWHNGRRHRR